MSCARDKFWIFGVRQHQDDVYLGRGKKIWPGSRITPAEGAFMLDIPNVIMVNCDGEPVPFSNDAYGYAESFARMNKVLWGATGSGGFRIGNEEVFIRELADKYPNIAGAFMDDFFGKFAGTPDADVRAEKLLSEIRTGLDKADRPMKLYVVWYMNDQNKLKPELLRYIDGITLWTWKAQELKLLKDRFNVIEHNFAGKKKMLGVYMYEFDTGEPISDELMEYQCEFGLELMKQGRLDGMIFEANSVMGIGLPSELWLRKWIEKVKYTEVI